jgi:acetyltransferase-like isoleucine patch superfamily enzyme
VLIGSGAVVLPGADIARGAVIGAGSIVSGSVPEYAIVVGAPARVVGYRQ